MQYINIYLTYNKLSIIRFLSLNICMQKPEQHNSKSLEFQQNTFKTNLLQFLFMHSQKQYSRCTLHSILIVMANIYMTIFFLTFKSVGILRQDLLVIPHQAAYVCFGIVGLIIFEVIISFLYHKSFFLELQIVCVRYLILMPLVTYLINATQQNVYPASVPHLLLIIIISIVVMLNLLLGEQSFSHHSIIPKQFPINSYLIIFEILFCVGWFVEGKLDNYFSNFLLYTAILSELMIPNNLACKNLQYKLLRIESYAHILYSFVLFYNKLSTETIPSSIIYFSLVCLLCKIFSEFIKINFPKLQCVDVFDVEHTPANLFVQRIQYLVNEIRSYQEMQIPEFANSILVAFCQINQKVTSNVKDSLAHQTKKGLLKGLKQQKIMKNALNKISKRIDQLFIQYCHNQPQNLLVRIAYIKFKIQCFQSKAKMIEILAEIDPKDLGWFACLDYHIIKKYVSKIENSQMLDSVKCDQSLQLFQNRIYHTLNYMMEFWSQFFQQRVDLKKLFNIAEKLIPVNSSIHHQVLEQAKVTRLITAKILILYAEFTRTILNDQMKANIIDDYVYILKKKLAALKDFQHFLTDSQVGMIAISLSQVNIGSIKLCNDQAASIFSYTKEELVKIKINELMPKTFSVNHDQLLYAFMRNRNKKVNTDNRNIYGKNKFKYMIPIQLQLQKAFSSMQQQLIFLAQIKKAKCKSAPISCVVNSQAIIEDYSSLFFYMFLRGKNKNFQQVNIEDVIPTFFSQITSSLDLDIIKFNFTTCYKNQIIDLVVNVIQINFSHKQSAGYIVKCDILRSKKLKTRLPITTVMNHKFNDGQLSFHQMKYQLNQNVYAMSPCIKNNHKFQDIENQYTIPFMLLSDVADILKMDESKPKYDENIRTIRLVGSHYQRVEEAQSFQSDFFEQQDIKNDMKNKLKQMKEGIVSKEQEKLITVTRIILSIILVCIIIMSAIIFMQFIFDSSNYEKNVKLMINKLNIRGLVSEHLVYCQAIANKIQVEFYTKQKKIIEQQIIGELNGADITEQQKQNILKILYLQDQVNYQNLVNDDTLYFDLGIQNENISTYLGICLILLYLAHIICSLVAILLFKCRIIALYSLFLTLDEKSIRKLYDSCMLLQRKIQKQTNKNQENVYIDKNKAENQQDDENPVEKVKKFKNMERDKQKVFLLKLILPMIICMLCVIAIQVATIIRENEPKQQLEVQQMTLSIISDSSIELLKTLTKKKQNQILKLSTNFKSQLQSYEMRVGQLLSESEQHLLDSLFYSNSCLKLVNKDMCQKFQHGIMKKGVSKALNFLAIHLENFQKTSNNSTSLENLMKLEYELIKPVLLEISTHLEKERATLIASKDFNFQLLFIIFLTLTVLIHLYQVGYSLEEMRRQLVQTKQLIKIMSPQQKKTNKDGYAPLQN